MLPSLRINIQELAAPSIYNKNKRAAETLSELDNNSMSVEVDVLANYNYELLLKVISSLSDNSKEVLYMYYLNGFTTKEISDMLGISADNVWKRIERAKKQLKKRLEENEHNV